jgi:hypothetical protein
MQHLLKLGAQGMVVILFGITIMAISLRAMLVPDRLRRLVQWVTEPGTGYIAGTVIRLVLGLSLLGAADHARWPTVFTAIGGLTVIAAFALLLLGRPREARMAELLAGFSDNMLRVALVPALLFGVFLLLGMAPES